jgi:hypothetical protein
MKKENKIIIWIGIILNLYVLSACSFAPEKEMKEQEISTYLKQIKAKSFRSLNLSSLQSDTLLKNIPMNYSKAYNLLKHTCQSIDVSVNSYTTKSLLKSYIIADFVYAAFSFQFLGSYLGKSTDVSSVKNWPTLDLSICYDKANSNDYAVFCNERSIFFCRLLEKLTGLKSQIISIQNKHTFPLVFIKNRRFLIDPYDPFITCNDSNELIDFYTLIKNQSQKVHPVRTPRVFGASRQLVSQRFVNEALNGETKLANIPNAIASYISLNREKLIKHTPVCYVPDTNKCVLYPVMNKKNCYAFSLTGRIDGRLEFGTDIYKFYTNFSCK